MIFKPSSKPFPEVYTVNPYPPHFSDYCMHHSSVPVMVVRREAGSEVVMGAEAMPPPLVQASVGMA